MAPLILTIVAFLHIFFAIAWLGSGLYLSFVLGPRLRTFSPPGAMEFLARTGKSTLRYAAVVSSLTIVFGLALLYVYFGADYTRWPLTLEIGFMLGLLAFFIGQMVVTPALGKASDIAKEYTESSQQGPSPAEIQALMRKGVIGAALGTVLLIITALFMVATAFY